MTSHPHPLTGGARQVLPFLDRFPWFRHRSLAEVAETEDLRSRKRSGERWHGNAIARLQVLEARALQYTRPCRRGQHEHGSRACG